jgi:hypothetical protein
MLVFINHLHSNILILACNISTQVPKMTGSLSHPHAHTAASPLFASSKPKCLSSSHHNDLLTGLPPFRSPLDLKNETKNSSELLHLFACFPSRKYHKVMQAVHSTFAL